MARRRRQPQQRRRLRPARPERARTIAAVNFSPVGRADYRFGVPPKKTYREVFTTDLPAYGGTGDWRNEGELLTESIPSHGKPCSLCVTIPPLGAVFFAGQGEWQEEEKTNEPSEV